jgi:uncharacterized protein (UPF0212 family)
VTTLFSSSLSPRVTSSVCAPHLELRWFDFVGTSFCQVRCPFCQVHFFSAKFVACLPSLVQTLQSFCQVFCVSAKLSWQKIANSNELAENCQLGATQYKIHEFHRERVQQFRVGNFLPTRSSWQKAQNLAERPRTWQKRNEKAETGEAPYTERYQGIHPASSTS